MNQAMCEHINTAIDEASVLPFVAPVAVEPYTHENPAAHGNVSMIEYCLDCGAERWVNDNQGFAEYGPWGISRAEQRRRNEARRQRELERQRELWCESARRLLDAYDVVIDQVTEHKALVVIDGEALWLWRRDIRAAARQTDNGDAIVPFYWALCERVEAEAPVEPR